MKTTTVGELIDRLTITNLKLWFVQQWIHDTSEGAPFTNEEALENIEKLAELNLQRSALVQEIDEMLAAGTFRAKQQVKLK